MPVALSVFLSLSYLVGAGEVVDSGGESVHAAQEFRMQDVVTAIGNMGPMRLLFFTGIAMVGVGVVVFVVRLFRFRRGLKATEEPQ